MFTRSLWGAHQEDLDSKMYSQSGDLEASELIKEELSDSMSFYYKSQSRWRISLGVSRIQSSLRREGVNFV